MIRASHAILGLLPGLLATAAARADTISGVSVERVVVVGSETLFNVELRIRTETGVSIFIRELVPPGLVVTDVSGGGVLAGQSVSWAMVITGPGEWKVSYRVVIAECQVSFPVGPGTFRVGDDECPIDGEDRGDCTKIPQPQEGTPFRRGDFDQNAAVDITDAINLLSFLFLGGSAPACPDAADADDNGAIELSDAVRILDRIFLGGPLLPPPGSEACGPDPTPDGLGCGRGC